MTNLLEETLGVMDEFGLTYEDVTYVGSENNQYQMTWDEFESLADMDYDSGYGAPEVATDLEIRFQDGAYFVRAEYDGSEWWDAVIPRVNPESSTKPITRLIVSPKEIGWMTIAELAASDEAEAER